jgi:hypothetical protein
MLVFIINAFCKKGKHFSKISGKGRGRRQPSIGYPGIVMAVGSPPDFLNGYTRFF